MNDMKIIAVEQLPVIVERLQVIKEDVTKRVEDALSLECTEETVQYVKAARAELNSELKYWEDKRKEVKRAILNPYEQFEAVYKDCVSDVFKNADVTLKGKIESVENERKAQKRAAVEAYFNEYLASKNISMPLTFECAEINVTLSASPKSLKDQAKAFIDRVCEDLELIETQEFKDEIYLEYNSTWFLNVKGAIAAVVNRHKALEEAKQREEERKAREAASLEAVERVEAVVETLAPPTDVEQTLTLRFTVKGTRTQLKALKEFLTNNNYDFE